MVDALDELPDAGEGAAPITLSVIKAKKRSTWLREVAGFVWTGFAAG